MRSNQIKYNWCAVLPQYLSNYSIIFINRWSTILQSGLNNLTRGETTITAMTRDWNYLPDTWLHKRQMSYKFNYVFRETKNEPTETGSRWIKTSNISCHCQLLHPSSCTVYTVLHRPWHALAGTMNGCVIAGVQGIVPDGQSDCSIGIYEVYDILYMNLSWKFY